MIDYISFTWLSFLSSFFSSLLSFYLFIPSLRPALTSSLPYYFLFKIAFSHSYYGPGAELGPGKAGVAKADTS